MKRWRTIGVLALALTVTTGACAQPITLDQCRTVAIVMGQVFEALPRDTLSLEFRQSFNGFIRATNKCAAPYRVEVMTEADARAYVDVAGMLLERAPPIDLRLAIELIDLRPPPLAVVPPPTLKPAD